MKLYSLEEKSNDWRFYSLFNGMRGGWTTKAKAIEDGEYHTRILKSIHPELIPLLNEDR